MRYSQLFGKATKSVNKEATATSHRYLLQAGYIRMLSAGRYSFLPLGLKVTKKIEQIIREEVEKTGAQEVIVPTLHPIELWKSANRDKKFGASMMRVTDRNQAEFTLGATAEVVMLDLVKQFSPTYKDLPINIYQFSQKFRDEARPTGGLLRTREFVMKDGYSFHVDEKSLQDTYKQYWDAYLRIARRLNLEVVVVESDNGAIGGSVSHEFMVKTDVGEDTIAYCECGYAANIETAEFIRDNVNLDEPEKPKEIVSQPEWVETMEDNVKHYGKDKRYFLKNVVFKDADGTIVIGVVRGDLKVNKAKLAKLYGAKGELEPASDQDLAAIGTRPGWVHCWGHDQTDSLNPNRPKVVYVGDLSLKTVHNFIGGQKEKDTDAVNVNYGRDFEYELLGDIAEVEQGFDCPKCAKWQLKLAKAVEFGNIFNIGYTYSDPMEGNFVAQDGSLKKIYMGSYGIGLGRCMATLVEVNHDDKGIIWPQAVAPYQIHLVGLDLHDQDTKTQAETLYQQLQDKGLEVLFDDRPEATAGVKFADADLIGIPLRVVISKRSLQNGGVEIKHRHLPDSRIIPLEGLITELASPKS